LALEAQSRGETTIDTHGSFEHLLFAVNEQRAVFFGFEELDENVCEWRRAQITRGERGTSE
jgi:hypothetical protein